ncbi:MAG: hypothetical protein EOO14_00515 [Chitinophagaceae bacterium]|nr:MAG: hypothetical protein EOO14_00515 [Chitinophagaceae bacterium]
MKCYRIFSLFVFSFFSICLQAQCLVGDCAHGEGKYNFGYAVYSGQFKNGLPHGKGTMDYGEGEKFTGLFEKGKENGFGILTHKNGVQEEVEYSNGNIVRKQAVVVVGGNVKVEGCIQGDCLNGFGAVQFESGNRYEGNFVNGSRQGKGRFVFAEGNVFEGEFAENLPVSGTFSYTKDRVTFTGTFYADGSPRTGTYHYLLNESKVEVKENVIVKISNPKAEALDAAAKPEPGKQRTCTTCSGKGITGSASTYSYTTPGTYTMSQFGQGRIMQSNPQTHTSTGRTFYNLCSKCKGSGKL